MSLLALSLRSVVRGRRVAFVVALPLLVGLVAVLLTVTAGDADRTGAYGTLSGHLLVLVLGLVGLVLGVNAFGDERDEGTLGLLLATTLSHRRIVLTKYAAAAAVSWLACLPATLGCLLLATRTELPVGTAAWSLLLGSALAAVSYAGVFVLLSLLLRRAVLVGLAYLVLWEGLLAGATTAFRNLSLGAYAGRVLGAPFDTAPFAVADVSVRTAVAVLLVVAVVAVAAAGWRLPRAHL
ncbi:MAG: ABC transporter permease subunit [Mycobacteriales bacterium]